MILSQILNRFGTLVLIACPGPVAGIETAIRVFAVVVNMGQLQIGKAFFWKRVCKNMHETFSGAGN